MKYKSFIHILFIYCITTLSRPDKFISSLIELTASLIIIYQCFYFYFIITLCFSYGGLDTIATILNEVSQYLSTLKSLEKFQNLVNRHKTDFKPILESLESSLEVANYELNWTTEASVPIIRWLKAYYDDSNNKSKYRLPPNIEPENYTVFITPFLESGNFTFNGNVTIEANVIQATDKIVLHSAEIKHHNITVIANQTKIRVISRNIVNKYDFYIINLSEKLNIGTKLIIEIIYTGHLNTSEFRGFYKGSYVNEAGETR